MDLVRMVNNTLLCVCVCVFVCVCVGGGGGAGVAIGHTRPGNGMIIVAPNRCLETEDADVIFFK